MKVKLEYLSSHLKTLRRKLDDARHGGLVLTGDQLDAFIGEVDGFIDMSRALEECISSTEWNRRAAADRAQLMTPAATVVLEMMRPNTNIVAFPKPHPHSPLGGGTAA
ncbi:hypothetical protein ACXHXM_02145